MLLFFPHYVWWLHPVEFSISLKKIKLTTYRAYKQEEKWSEWVFSGCCTIGLYPYSGAPLLDRNSQSSIYGQSHAASASYSDSASPVGLEFWLPGKISVLGERGLSFACSHPSCTTRKGPLSTSPVYKEHLHWWSAFACVCLVEKQQHLFRSGFFIQQEVLKVLDAVLQGCGHFESSITHKHKQLPSIFLWIAQKKKREKKQRGTIATQKKSCLLNNSLFQSVDTALTKYSTLRIVHIGRTEEGGKTCGPGFPSQVWIGSRYLSREKKTQQP